MRKIKKAILPLALIGAMVVPTELSTVYAKGSMTAENDYQIFVPFRSYIPSYLIRNSSERSEVVKKLWAKVFYEETNWDQSHPKFYDEHFGSWVDKYDDKKREGGRTKYLSLLDESEKYLQDGIDDNHITLSSGDFEAAFGNTIKNNPEFFGQLAGVEAYAPIGEDEAGNALMANIVNTYLAHPEKYPNFTKSFTELTKDGMYIGTNKTSEDNLLKDKNCTVDGSNNSMDIYALTALSSLYEGDGDETYLSDHQVEWLKSYQSFLYDQYVDDKEHSLANRIPSIYDLIARSEQASNNYRGKGQEFFDYVVESGHGAGSWLNNIDGVDIQGLKEVDNLVTLFQFANGYCHSHEPEDKCVSAKDCKPMEDGGKSTVADNTAYLLHKEFLKGGLLKNYIQANISVFAAYSSDDESWVSKFNVRHDKTGAALYYNKNVYAASGGNASKHAGAYSDSGFCSCDANTSTVLTVDSSAFLPNARAITVLTSCSERGGIYNYSVYSNGKNITHLVPRSGSSFDISKLDLEERENATLTVNISASAHAEYNALEYNESHTGYNLTPGGCGCDAIIRSQPYVVCSCRRSDCVIYGHEWAGKVEWSKDNQTATIKYSCTKDVSHVIEIKDIATTRTEDNNYIYYTVSGGPYVFKEDGSSDSYTKTIVKGTGASSETIALNSSNTTGSTSSTGVSSGTIYGDGSWSQAKNNRIFSSSSASVSFLIKAGTIKPGAQSITVNVSAYENLTGLSVAVYSASGELIATNDFATSYKTCYLYRLSDSRLENCKVIVTASASTTNFASTQYGGVSDAEARISVPSITVNY
ncbi:hypothetical protein [Pseudobutyrivibrio sp. YE44]|uniref:hypothetical protein n=1 Tax=Pseudobutyrivibrio sp. YE44 TaxID=1520802 RepID=UPI00115FB2C4|nr:hypothetical protein [Pseudobutyrivibrio sp. YE44]